MNRKPGTAIGLGMAALAAAAIAAAPAALAQDPGTVTNESTSTDSNFLNNGGKIINSAEGTTSMFNNAVGATVKTEGDAIVKDFENFNHGIVSNIASADTNGTGNGAPTSLTPTFGVNAGTIDSTATATAENFLNSATSTVDNQAIQTTENLVNESTGVVNSAADSLAHDFTNGVADSHFPIFPLTQDLGAAVPLP